MVAVDTNIIVRLLTRDDKQQYAAAHQLFSHTEIFIPESVLLESEWVLRYAYEYSPKDISRAFRKLLGLPNVHTANAQKLAQTIDWHEAGLDFADALHLANCQEHTTLKTFDAQFIKRAKNLGQCEVSKP